MQPPAGIPAHLGLLLQELRGLVRTEVALAKAEMEQGAAKLAVGVALIVGAAIFSFVAMIVLAGAAVLGMISLGYSPLVATLAVGIGTLIIASLMAFIGLRRIKPETLIPKRAIANIKADLSFATGGPNGRQY